MIYVIYGSEISKTRAKWHGVIDSLVAKRPDASVFALTGEKGTVAELEELLVGQTLFDKKYIVTCDQILTNADLAILVKERVKEMAEAENVFVLLETAIEKKLLTAFERHAFKVVDFDKTEAKKTEKFNIFALTDALGARDRKQMWVLYQQALRANLKEEEIFWKLVWQVKNILLVKMTSKPDKLDMHPYALQKTKSYAGKYSIEELQSLFKKMLELYHDSRRGKLDFGIGLEQLVLEI